MPISATQQADAIGNQLITYINTGKYVHAKIYADLLTEAIASDMSASVRNYVVNALYASNSKGVLSDSQSFLILGSYLAKAGGYISGSVYASTIIGFTQIGNVETAELLVEAMPAVVVANLPPAARDGLVDVMFMANHQGLITDAEAANILESYLAKAGGYISGSVYASTIIGFASIGNAEAAQLLAEALPAGAAAYGTAMTQAARDGVINALYLADHHGQITDAEAANILESYLAKAGAYISGSAYASRIGDFASIGNAEAAELLAEALPAFEVPGMTQAAREGVVSTVFWANNYDQLTDAETADILAGYVGKAGDYLSFSGMQNWTAVFALADNFSAANAFVDNLSVAQFNALTASYKSMLLSGYGTQILTSGNDTATIGNAVDAAYGGAGNDTLNAKSKTNSGISLYGNDGSDTLYGTGYGDWLSGGDGNDTLSGGGGNDTLSGGHGIDFLTGGAGADRFVFKAGESGVDAITDFRIGQGDKLDISDLLTAYDPLTDALGSFVSVGGYGTGGTMVLVDRDGAGAEHTATAVASLINVSLTLNQLLNASGLIVADSAVA